MSNKLYRTPAREIRPPVLEPTPEVNVHCLKTVKRFLESILERAIAALDEAAELPKPQTENNHARYEWYERKAKAVANIARLGIAASRALLQALKLEGTDTEAIHKLVDQTVLKLTARAAAQAPELISG
jgi:hypothetical protein